MLISLACQESLFCPFILSKLSPSLSVSSTRSDFSLFIHREMKSLRSDIFLLFSLLSLFSITFVTAINARRCVFLLLFL